MENRAGNVCGGWKAVWNDRKGKNLRGGGAVSHILSKMGGTGSGEWERDGK
jgi:hypothetical protein